MRVPFHLARPHWQQRLGAIQGLNLRLLIGAEHECALRRIQIQAHDVPHLFHEERVLRELEGLGPMRLQAEGAPDAADRALARSSSNPSSRAATNRLRHLPTVCLVSRNWRAT